MRGHCFCPYKFTFLVKTGEGPLRNKYLIYCGLKREVFEVTGQKGRRESVAILGSDGGFFHSQ